MRATHMAQVSCRIRLVDASRMDADARDAMPAWHRRDRGTIVMACIVPQQQAVRASPCRLPAPVDPARRLPHTSWRARHGRTVAAAGLLCMPLAPHAAAIAGPDARFAGVRADVAMVAAARFAHGSLVMDGLHRRLGEIHNVMPTRDVGGELFLRHAGGRIARTAGSNLPRMRSRAGALQLGGAVAYWNRDGANQRAGWALDRGVLHATPGHAASSRDDIRGLAAWYTRQSEGGAYVDTVIRRAGGAGRVPGAAKVRTAQWTFSTEAGAPLPIGDDASVEPQLQLSYHSLRTTALRGVGSLRARQASLRLGARIARIDNERFVPYVQLDLEQPFAGRSRAAPAGGATGERAAVVRNGRSLRLSTGVTIKVHRSVDVYAHAGVQRRLADGGNTGAAFGAGLRINV